MLNLHLVPECYADTALVKNLFSVENDDINHADGIHKIALILRNSKEIPKISIGFTDNDKHNTPSYFQEFETVEELDNIIFKKHKTDNTYLFVFKKAIESFLQSELSSKNKMASDFGFDNQIKKFSKKLKKTNVEENESFQQLISFIKTEQTSGCQFISTHIAKIRQMQP